MNVSRVKVFNAIFNQMAGYIKANYQDYPNVPQFLTFSKAYRPYTKTNSDQQPAFYLALGPEAPDQAETPGATRWELTFYAIFLLNLDPLQQNPTACEVLLSTLDMIDDSLLNNGRPQNLASQNGGVPLVYNTFLDRRNGKVEIRQPVALPQAALIVPITVITGGFPKGART